RVGSSRVMVSDGNAEGATFAGFSLSIAVSTDGEADTLFAALANEGTIGMPLTKTFWAPKFGMVTDRFGVGWMVTVAPSNA
ncbi:MAG TPA: VOC family protein, partial [Opitutaceae bacterium]|nr:VOC family protein [Opitutaceae bacterium]